jgi:hypothetical protein
MVTNRALLDNIIRNMAVRTTPVGDRTVTREQLERIAKEQAGEEAKQEAQKAYDETFSETFEEAYQRILEELLDEHGFSD